MTCQIDGRTFPVVEPETVADLCMVVRESAGAGRAIYPVGGRTMLHCGLPPTREGIVLDGTKLQAVVDYPSRDMTITVEAGIRIERLAAILKGEGQRLPVDIPMSGAATLGGSMAANASGPRRLGFGTLRDYVIGITVVDASGSETKAGGRVVKNVAGYDLCKLYIGSFGALGFITQATLKLKPLPESAAIAWIPLDSDEITSQALDRLAKTRTRPTAIELLNGAGAARVIEAAPLRGLPCGQSVLVVGFEENSQAVQWQKGQMARELSELAVDLHWLDDSAVPFMWNTLADFQLPGRGAVSFKANFRSSSATEWLSIVRSLPVELDTQVHAGNGIAYGHMAVDDLDTAANALNKLRAFAVAQRGNLVVRRCPIEWKEQIPVWGEPRTDLWLMQEVQKKLDPNGIWNSGRFFRP